jgi:hypothetical protein
MRWLRWMRGLLAARLSRPLNHHLTASKPADWSVESGRQAQHSAGRGGHWSWSSAAGLFRSRSE